MSERLHYRARFHANDGDTYLFMHTRHDGCTYIYDEQRRIRQVLEPTDLQPDTSIRGVIDPLLLELAKYTMVSPSAVAKFILLRGGQINLGDNDFTMPPELAADAQATFGYAIRLKPVGRAALLEAVHVDDTLLGNGQ